MDHSSDELELENVRHPETQKSISKSIEDCQDFDDILNIVGSNGKYQRFLLYAILFPFSVLEGILVTNIWLFLDEPNHWCHVPGREEDGYDLETWKNLTLPQNEQGVYSKCRMYTSNKTEVACESGWDYDFTDVAYRSIVPDFDWVCDQSNRVTLVHTSIAVGRVCGTLFFGFLADKIGRKPVFIACLFLYTFVRMTSLYLVNNIWLFVIITTLTSTAGPMYAISNTMVGVELSGEGYRAWMLTFIWTTVTLGSCAVPLIVLILPNWMTLGWTTVLLGSIAYFLLPWFPESPRWLLSQGKVVEVARILRNVAEWNGTSDKVTDHQLLDALNEITSSKSDTNEDKSIFKLFSKPRMAFHMFLIVVTWSLNSLMFRSLNLNSLNLHGHRHLNFILVNLVEIPGSFFGGVFADKLGRRWFVVGLLFLSTLTCLTSLYFSGTSAIDTTSSVIVIFGGNLAKFLVTMSFLVVNIQAAELLPTTFRTSGQGFTSCVSNIVSIGVPYLILSGKDNPATAWIVCSVVSILATISSSFIPETFKQKLPENVYEANKFGKGRPFWIYKVWN